MKIFLIDCGQAKKMTRGNFFGVYYELSTPPINYRFEP